MLKLKHADTQLILDTRLEQLSTGSVEQLSMAGGVLYTIQVSRFPRRHPVSLPIIHFPGGSVWMVWVLLLGRGVAVGYQNTQTIAAVLAFNPDVCVLLCCHLLVNICVCRRGNTINKSLSRVVVSPVVQD